jgi:hypothetical protein
MHSCYSGQSHDNFALPKYDEALEYAAPSWKQL